MTSITKVLIEQNVPVFVILSVFKHWLNAAEILRCLAGRKKLPGPSLTLSLVDRVYKYNKFDICIEYAVIPASFQFDCFS